MITIELNKLRFYSHHGVHDEETIVGTDFEINAAVTFNETGKIATLSDTINYVDIYQVIKEQMQHPSRLLETVAINITDSIAAIDPRIKTINICISKINPPINNFTGNVSVTYSKVFL